MMLEALSLDSDLLQVPKFANQLRATCSRMGVGDSDATIVEICVVEAVNNAIEHAYSGRGGRTVDVTIALSQCELVIEIRDTGIPMPRVRLATATISEPDPTDIASLPERGMGLAILKEAMDDVRYTSHSGINTLTLQKHVMTEETP